MKNWRDRVRRVTPYTPGEQPKETKLIKLNTNENPYPPSPLVTKALREMDTELLRRYPDPAGEPLLSAIADSYGLPKEQVFVGVGSDDVLAMAFLTFFQGEEPILFPDITYSFYDVWAECFRIPYRTIPLDADFHIRPEDYHGEVGGIVIANPNAPTGEALPLSSVESIVRANPEVLVIVDEAYVDFGGESAVPLIGKYDNLMVVQTFSKSRSLAGMRIGCAFGTKEQIAFLNDVKYSFNSYTMNLPAILLGEAAIRDREYFEETRSRILRTRAWVSEELRKEGFVFPDSAANFLFVTHPALDCVELFRYLREKKIFVRHFEKPERIRPFLRITIGTDEEMESLLEAVKEFKEQK